MALRQTDAGPLTTGAAGVVLTVTAWVAFALPQLLVTVNATLPDAADAPQVVVMELVPCPAVIVTPLGTVQL